MKGSAPNFSATGSQICFVRNDHPNAWRAREELLNSSMAIAAAMAKIPSANAWVRLSKKASPRPILDLRRGSGGAAVLTMLMGEKGPSGALHPHPCLPAGRPALWQGVWAANLK